MPMSATAGGAAALLMDMGTLTGKSLTTIGVLGRLYLDDKAKRVLIVAPSSVVSVWPKEFNAHADYDHTVAALTGTSAQRRKKLADLVNDGAGMLVAVINYESTWRLETELAAFDADVIVCDESQRIKSPGAAQSKCLVRLGGRARRRMILTGTPVTQSPTDFFGQYKFLDPTVYGTSFAAFKARYCYQRPVGSGGAQMVVGMKPDMLSELVEKAHSIAFRVTKGECLDLPEQVDQVRECDLEPGARNVYEQLVRDSIAELAGGEIVVARSVLTRLLRLSQLTGGFVTDDEAASQQVSTAKLKLLADTLDDLAGRKVVIFARFTAEIDAICQMLDKRPETGFVRIDGSTPQACRGDLVTAFQESPEITALVGQIDAAGTGLTLTAADTAIFYSLTYSYATYDQARSRIHRIGQRNTCTYVNLVARGTVDEKVLEVLAEKKSIAELCVDNWRELIR